MAALWGAAAYAQLKECPTQAKVSPTAATDDAGLAAAVATAMNLHIYDTAVAGATVTGFDISSGQVAVKRDGSTILTYAVTEVSSGAGMPLQLPVACCRAAVLCIQQSPLPLQPAVRQ